jgi:nicotinate-nucleotide pyrophosphorylase (carboxylating)
MIRDQLQQFFTRYLDEDIGSGDHSTLSCIDKDARGKCRLLAKQEGVIAGLDIIHQLFQFTDPGSEIIFNKKDSDTISPGEVVFTITGLKQKLLSTERLALNILQRMSGIATETRRYTKEIEELHTRILDTRKTTPGFRYFEKEAVRIGGGHNHRFGLFDMIMLKDNHIDFAGGIEKAIDRTLDYLQKKQIDLKIEIETRNISDIERVIKHGKVQRIMFDNFSITDTMKAVKLVNGRFETESSGGITFENLRDYALCGVDFISVGALTHQIHSLDLSLKAV